MNIKLNVTASLALLMVNVASTQVAYAEKHKANSSNNEKVFEELSSFPTWFQDAMAREKKIKKKSKLKIESLNVNKKVLGKLKLIDAADGNWYYNIDIGAGSPAECYFFTEFDGPANSLYAILDSSFPAIEEINKATISGKYNYAIGSGVIGEAPYMLLDTLYSVGEGDKKNSGLLKGLSAETSQGLALCLHNEIGYRKTFFSVFESFANAFETESPEFFKQITQMQFNDIPVGYTSERFVLDSDGDVMIVHESSALIPVDASSVSRSDSESTSWSSPDGSLINATEYSVENSTLASKLSINHVDGNWEVVGEIQGKEATYQLEHNDWLLSDFGSYLETARLLASDNATAGFSMWSPEADPSTAIKFVINKVADNPKANMKMSMGSLVVQMMAEDNGVIQSGYIQQGPVTIDFKQVFLEGEPSLPK